MIIQFLRAPKCFMENPSGTVFANDHVSNLVAESSSGGAGATRCCCSVSCASTISQLGSARNAAVAAAAAAPVRARRRHAPLLAATLRQASRCSAQWLSSNYSDTVRVYHTPPLHPAAWIMHGSNADVFTCPVEPQTHLSARLNF